MPAKKDPGGHSYTVTGKTFTWRTEDGATVTIPMRIKMRVLRAVGGESDLSPEVMFTMLEGIAPGQADAFDEMDVNEFTRMFSAWQREYQLLNGASLGEAESSPA